MKTDCQLGSNIVFRQKYVGMRLRTNRPVNLREHLAAHRYGKKATDS